MPLDAIYVGRPSIYGNPVPISGDWISWMAIAIGYRADEAGRHAASVSIFRSWITDTPIERGPEKGDQGEVEYTDGTRATIADLTVGFAAMASTLYEAPRFPDLRPDLTMLRGHDLVCWCPLGVACHTDVLLDLANR